jgi:hypothetical protein
MRLAPAEPLAPEEFHRCKLGSAVTVRQRRLYPARRGRVRHDVAHAEKG